jgi:hypothetical protein
MVYAVDVTRLCALFAPADADAAAAWIRTHVRDDPTASGTLLAMLRGEGDGLSAIARHHAVEAAAERLGRALPNAALCPMVPGFYVAADDILQRAGVALQIGDLIYRGSPVGVPR